MTDQKANQRALRRIRLLARATLVLGVAASIAANVLHARNSPISQGIAAWPPLVLLLTVELVARVPVHRRSLAVVRIAATTSIAGIAAWVSYWHMAGVCVIRSSWERRLSWAGLMRHGHVDDGTDFSLEDSKDHQGLGGGVLIDACANG